MNRRHVNSSPHRPRRAFTLVESVMSILIIGVMLVTALDTVGAAAKAEFMMSERNKGYHLAEALLSEVCQQPYSDAVTLGTIGTEAGETGLTRAKFDDVDDYHNWSGAPQDKNGVAIAGADDYTLSVTIAWVSPDNLAATKLADTKVKKITVTGTRGGRVVAVLSAYRTAAIADPVRGLTATILPVVTK